MKRAIQLLQNSYQQYKDDLLRISAVGMVFGVVKLAGFATAILLAQLVSDVAVYGTFEFALTLGIVLSLMFNMGLQAAYPFFNLKKQDKGYRSLFYRHAFGVGFFALGILILNQYVGWDVPQKYLIALLFGAIIAIQNMLSSILKSHDKILQAVILDGTALILCNIYVVYLFVIGDPFHFDILQQILTVYLVALIGLVTYNWKTAPKDFTTQRYVRAMTYARPVLLATILVIGLTGSGRIMVDYFFDETMVGYYSFYLRFATLTVMLQQVFIVAFFRKIYQSNPAYLDRYFAGFILVAVGFSLTSFTLVPIVFGDSLSLLQHSYTEYKSLFLVLSTHTIFWTGMALNENVIYREELSKKMTTIFAAIFTTMLVAMYLLYYMESLSIFNFAILNALALYIAVESQHWMLNHFKSIDLKNMQMMLRVSLIIYTALYFFI